DPHSMFLKRGPTEMVKEDSKREEPAAKFKSKDYLDRWINPPAALEAEQKKLRDEKAKHKHETPARPTRDVLQYLLDHANLEDWQGGRPSPLPRGGGTLSPPRERRGRALG